MMIKIMIMKSRARHAKNFCDSCMGALMAKYPTTAVHVEPYSYIIRKLQG